MRTVADVLREEHRLIHRAAACLDRVADEALEGGELDGRAAADLVELFEELADGAHQEKEERCLFPALASAGLARGRLAELLRDHARERALLESLRGELEAAAYGDALSLDAFAQRAQRYAELQTSHASFEDDVLLPLADELPAARQREVLAGFAAVDGELLRRPCEVHAERLHRIARALGSAAEAR